MIDERIFEQFRAIGRDLYVAGMISSHGGNLSVRLGDRVVIKRRGAMLGNLKPNDLVDTGLEKNDSGVALASTELLAHRTIYKMTPALSIVHCHPRMAIAFSLSRDEIVPVDNEASYLLKKIPVVTEEFASGTPRWRIKLPRRSKITRSSCCAVMAVSRSDRPSTRRSSGPPLWRRLVRSLFMRSSSTNPSLSTAR